MKLKYLTEQRAENQNKMQEILNQAKLEERAMSETEISEFNELKKKIEGIDVTIRATDEIREEKIEMSVENTNNIAEDKSKIEERAFEQYIRNPERADTPNNMALGDNGAVIPTTIAKKIIEQIKDICPIYSMAEIYNVKGTLMIPYYGDKDNNENVRCAYATEFTDLTSYSGKFTSISLSSFLAGALTKVSRSLINNSQFNIVGFVTRKISEAIAEFLENELINGTGTTTTCQGVLTGATNVVTTSTTGAIVADDLIDLQESVIDNFQSNAVFIMNRATRALIRKFKDGNGEYFLNRDFDSNWGYRLLGKPVYTTDSMPTVSTGAKAIIYGDLTGLSVKLSKGVEIQVLNELYAAQHAVGIVGWVEIDSKVTEQQKLAVLQIKS
ncbi:phage capsid protein [Clostridia bacterium]|nr:phage capsid protein [Clostridia bacterium]